MRSQAFNFPIYSPSASEVRMPRPLLMVSSEAMYTSEPGGKGVLGDGPTTIHSANSLSPLLLISLMISKNDLPS